MKYSAMARKRLAVFVQSSERVKKILLPFVKVSKRGKFITDFNELVRRAKDRKILIYARMEAEMCRVHVELSDLYPLIGDEAMRAPTDKEFLQNLLKKLEDTIANADNSLRTTFRECSELDDVCEKDFSEELQSIALLYAGISRMSDDK